MTLTKLEERDRHRRTSASDKNLIALTPIDNQDKKQSIEKFRKNFSMMASGEGLDFQDLDQIEKTGLKTGLGNIVCLDLAIAGRWLINKRFSNNKI